MNNIHTAIFLYITSKKWFQSMLQKEAFISNIVKAVSRRSEAYSLLLKPLKFMNLFVVTNFNYKFHFSLILMDVKL